MALHLIIDGYNLLALTGRIGAGTRLDSEIARESFLRDLASYRQRKSHAITVVFDGWQQGWGTEQREHRLGLEIIFSRRGEKADQVIQRLAAEFGSACAVVSSDREIINVATAQGAFVMKAQEFIGKLREAVEFDPRLSPQRAGYRRGSPAEARLGETRESAEVAQGATTAQPAAQAILNRRFAFSVVMRPIVSTDMPGVSA